MNWQAEKFLLDMRFFILNQSSTAITYMQNLGLPYVYIVSSFLLFWIVLWKEKERIRNETKQQQTSVTDKEKGKLSLSRRDF